MKRPTATTKNKSTGNYLILYYDILDQCNPYELAVVCQIAKFQNTEEGCYIKQPQLAKQAKLSVAQLRRALRALENKDIIKVTRHSNNLSIQMSDRSIRAIR